MTLGVIFGNRDFFPDGLVAEARRDLTQVLRRAWTFRRSALTPEQTKLGAVETWQDAVALRPIAFASRSQRIDGVLVCLPNFGDEKGIADALRLSELNCPVLVQACPDDLDQFGLERRRDAFCGKISVCNNLRQYGIKYSLTRDHTVAIKSARFQAKTFWNFWRSAAWSRGLRRVRIGAVGARPNAFNTTRYSEKLLEAAGISVNTIDLSEVFGRSRQRLRVRDARVKQRLGSDPRVRRQLGRAGRSPAARWQSSPWCSTAGWTTSVSQPLPSSAGAACRRTTASTSAPS